MINWHRTKNGIEKFSGNSVEMLYGTKDPSYKYYEILECINSNKLIYRKVDGADHNFAGMEYTFDSNIIEFINSNV